MLNRKPKIFIGSSSESFPIVEALCTSLADQGDIDTWRDPHVFPAAKFFLESLLDTKGKYDYGFFIFGPDDIVDSRGVAKPAPRDNVLFELGLFMRELGRERAVAIAPRGKVRVLSDLSGLKLVEWEKESPPDIAVEVRAQLLPLLEAGPMARENVGLGPDDALGAGDALDELLAGDHDRTVDHLGLDLESAWPYLSQRIRKDKNLRWRTLMIDPDSERLKNVESPSVSVDMAKLRIGQIASFCAKNPLDGRFACKRYAEIPRMHGYLLNRRILLWSVCGMEDGKLMGYGNRYWRFDAECPDSYAASLVDSFATWFDYLWQHASKPVWPTQ